MDAFLVQHRTIHYYHRSVRLCLELANLELGIQTNFMLQLVVLDIRLFLHFYNHHRSQLKNNLDQILFGPYMLVFIQ